MQQFRFAFLSFLNGLSAVLASWGVAGQFSVFFPPPPPLRGRARLCSSCGGVATWALGGEAKPGPGLKCAWQAGFKAGWAADGYLVCCRRWPAALPSAGTSSFLRTETEVCRNQGEKRGSGKGDLAAFAAWNKAGIIPNSGSWLTGIEVVEVASLLAVCFVLTEIG